MKLGIRHPRKKKRKKERIPLYCKKERKARKNALGSRLIQ